MEKNIVVTMSVMEARRFENDCEGFKVVFDKFIEKLSETEGHSDSMAISALNGHMKRLEKITDIFSTKVTKCDSY